MSELHHHIMAQRQEETDLGDRPSTRASNVDAPDYITHIRSRSTAHTHSAKRLSVLTGRTRSNTAASTSTSSHEERLSGGVRHERHESVTKSIFSRSSRILRRQGSKFNISATLDEEDEGEREKSHIFSRHHKTRQSDAHDQLKNMISNPFDFHHLTHTSPSQFPSLERTRENDLVAEFSAIRASQRPVTELKGIRVEDLHFSSEDLTNGGTANPEEDQASRPLTSPPGSPGASSGTSPKQVDFRSRRESRIYENFSRPVSRYRKTPPPRAISPQLGTSPDMTEPAPRAIDEILGLSSQPTYPEFVYSNSDDLEKLSSLSQMNVEAMFHSDGEHAINSGADNEAIDARTSSVSLTNLSSDLEDVLEEEDATHWHSSPEINAENTASRAPSRFSPPADTAPKSHSSVDVAKELSKKFSEALGSPTIPQYRLSQETSKGPVMAETIRRRPSARRPTYETIYESWDADIDYCYEHAAESTSNFDWTCDSIDETRRTNELDRRPKEGGLLQPIHLSTPSLPTPDLDPSPSRSFVSSQAAITPSSAGYEAEAISHRAEEYFPPVNSSIFSSDFGKQMTQDTYEEYLAADAESDRHFSFGLIQSMDGQVSPRSSFSPISKCNSQESLILSRAASIVRKHRSSISTTSVPDLVHSLTNSRELPSLEHLPSSEQPANTSAYHRQTRSLAREIEGQVMSRAESNSSLDSAGVAARTGALIHDRSKSTSEVEALLAAKTATMATAPSPLPPIPSKSLNRRKARGPSYSLFPSAPTAI